MYKKTFFSILVLITANLLGCSTSKEYYIDPSYSEEKINASVLVLPLQRDWFDGNLSHTFGSISGQGKNAFYSSLEPLLSNNLESLVKMVDSEQTFNKDMFNSSKLKSGKDSLNVLLPNEQSSFITSSQNQPEIVLLLDQYYFLKKKKTTGNSTYAGHEKGITRTILYFETKYIYWDTKQEKAIAWGNTDSTVTLDKKDNATSTDYYEVLSKAVEKMSKQGPLL